MVLRQRMTRRRNPLVRALSILLLLKTVSSTSVFDDASSEECAILALVPFTDRGKTSAQYNMSLAFGHMAAVLMATEHFNARDPVVVPELASDEFIDCNVTIPMLPDWTIADDGYTKTEAVTRILDAHVVRQNMGKHICGIVGPYNTDAVLGAAMLAAGLDVPIISYHADNSQFGKSHFNPLTTKIVADEFDKADMLVNYLVNERKRGHIAMIHVISATEELKVTKKAAEDYKANFISEAVRPYNASMTNALKRIKKTGYRTIVVVLGRTQQWDELYKFAMEQNMTNSEYVWIAYDTTDLTYLTKETESLARAKLLNGAATLRVLDGFQYDPQNRFLQSWKSYANNASFVKRLNEINPIDPPRGGFGGGGGGGGGDDDYDDDTTFAPSPTVIGDDDDNTFAPTRGNIFVDDDGGTEDNPGGGGGNSPSPTVIGDDDDNTFAPTGGNIFVDDDG